MEKIMVTLPPEQVWRLDNIRSERRRLTGERITRSRLIEEAIEKALAEEDDVKQDG